MLTRKDFRHNFFLFRVISDLKILPVDFDPEHGILKLSKSPWKRRISLGFFILSILHGCYIHFRLVQVLLNPHQLVKLHHLVFHLDMSVATCMLQGWNLVCFVLYPETFVALFNEIFSAIAKNETRAGKSAHSRQELFALAMPVMVVLTAVEVVWFFAYDRSMSFILYSVLPEEYQTLTWTVLVFSEEVLFYAFIASTTILVLIVQLLFFENITGSLKLLRSSSKLATKYAEAGVERAYNQLREIQLKINLFNEINRYIIYSFKLFCIGMATLNVYFMIAYFSADPLFGCIYCAYGGLLCMLYSLIYERAFAIPEMVGLTKSIVRLRAGAWKRSLGFKRKTEMRLRSVPEVGIQVGRFHTFEREATLVFVDYVLRNVAGLLVWHLSN